MNGKKAASIYFLAFTKLSAASFEPYELNGGLISAIAGHNFYVICTDTRMIGPGGFLLSSRNYLSSRIWSVDGKGQMEGVEASFRSSSVGVYEQITASTKCCDKFHDLTMIGAVGCAADCEALKRAIRSFAKKSTRLGQMPSSPEPDQVASMLSHTLYSRRGFPFYSFCCVAGIGGVFVFDAIGSCEQVAVASAGTGRELLQPILDRVFRSSSSDRYRVDHSVDEVIRSVVKAYRSVSEREIGVGDKLVVHIAEKRDNAIRSKICVFPLKDH